MKNKSQLVSLDQNSRFWILLYAFITSILVILFFSATIDSSVLTTIRIQQTFGYMSLFLWYVVLLASPLSKIFISQQWMKHYLYARRALGVSTAYFALLHGLFAFFGQLDGFKGVAYYPNLFATAIYFGFAGLLILLALAVTSFDKIISKMGKNRWMFLHRLSYVASYLVLAHVWIIGTHARYLWVQLLLSGFMTILLALESWRIVLRYRKLRAEKLSSKKQILLFMLLWTTLFVVFASIPMFITSYGELHGNIQGH